MEILHTGYWPKSFKSRGQVDQGMLNNRRLGIDLQTNYRSCPLRNLYAFIRDSYHSCGLNNFNRSFRF